MAMADTDGNRRFTRGPKPLGALVPGLTRPAFRKRAPAAAQIMADWPSIVGPALAAATTPRKFAAGTLAIGCAGAVAMELQHLAPQLIARINGQLGQQIVERLRFVQEAPPALAPRPAPPRPQAVAAARDAVSTLEPGPLRDALEALGRRVLSRP